MLLLQPHAVTWPQHALWGRNCKTPGHHEGGREHGLADISMPASPPHPFPYGCFCQVLSAILVQFGRGGKKN